VVGAVLTAGCAQQVGEEGPAKPVVKRTVTTVVAAPLPTLPHARTRQQLAKVWVADNRITVGTREVDVAPLRADLAVSTRGGVYFLNAGELWFLAAHGARSTGYTGLAAVVTSADGRYLGLVDRNHGPSISGGAPLAAAVVYDTETGRLRLRSYVGMGRPSTRLASTYAGAPPTATGFGGGAMLASTPSGIWRYPLDGRAPTKVS